jgi:hypothetical protein
MKASYLFGLATLFSVPLFAAACSAPPAQTEASAAAPSGWVDFALLPLPLQNDNVLISNVTRSELR